MERHAAGEAIVIPVILRPCDWHRAPFGKLLGTPQDGKPVTLWPDRDEAFLQVAKEVRKAAERCSRGRSSYAPKSERCDFNGGSAPSSVPPAAPRSSNLHMAKSYTRLDKDRFLLGSFEYIARYFENSLVELQVRNPGYEGVFRRVDANHFSASIYKDGHDVAKATVFTGGQLGAGIYYSHGDSFGGGSYNEALTVDTDDQSMYLKTYGMAFHTRQDQKLSQEGGAESRWSLLIAPLQRIR